MNYPQTVKLFIFQRTRHQLEIGKIREVVHKILHSLEVQLERLSDLVFTHEVLDFVSEPLGIAIILVVIAGFAYFLMRLPK